MAYTPRVLVIDDLPETGRMIAKYLSRSGISLLTANTGEEGMALLQSEVVDAVLLDIDLGTYQEEGLDILNRIKNTRSLRHLPVVMLSVFDAPELKVRAFQLGAEDYITKPFEPVVLRARMEAVLRGVQSLRAVRRSKEKYHSLFQNSLVGMFRTSVADGRLLTCNTKALNMFGFGPEHLQVVRIADYYAHAGDRQRLVELLQSTGAVHDYEVEMRRLDGSPLWVSLSVQIFPDEGYLEGVVTDITERIRSREQLREKEAQFHATFNQAAVGIAHAAPDGSLLQVNQKISDILGYTTEELRSLTLMDLTHNDDQERSSTCIRMLLSAEIENCALEKRCRRRDGSFVWVQTTMSLVRDDATGEARYFIIVVEDIEDRKRSEKMLRQVVEGVSSKVGDSFFASLVAHLSTALHIDYAFVGEYIEEQNALQIKASCPDGKLAEHYTFSLEGTPAAEALKQGMVFYESDIMSLFPTAPHLAELEAEGYMGMALYDAGGKPLGLIAVISRTALQAREQKAALLKIFAVRAANELERKRSEQARKTSEANLKALFDNALQAFLLIDSGGVIRAMNRTAMVTARKLWGREVHEGDGIETFIRSESLHNFTSHFTCALSGRPIDLEWRVEASDGTDYWFEFSFTPVFVDGVVTGVCLSMLDITHRRRAVEQLARSEERFRTLIEKSTDIITILDEEAVIMYESPSIETVLGYRPQELIGRNALEFVHPEDVNRLYAILASVVDVPGAVVSFDFRFRHSDGHWRYLDATGTNMLHDPNIRGLIVNSRDITERVAAESERNALLMQLGTKNTELEQTIVMLKDAQAQLIQSERASAIGNLVAGVTHEINNPNAAIYGAIQDALHTTASAREFFLSLLAEDDRTSEEATTLTGMIRNIERTLEIASDGAERIKTIVSTLRSFTKHQEAEHQTGDLIVLIESTVTLFHYQFKHVDLRCRFPDGDALAITGNLGELNQVFLNLLVNAAQAGASVVEIEGWRNDQEELVVSFADNGRGMDEETRIKIFEPFFTTRGAGNTGLGLNITRKIIDKHNARISVESQPGQGAVFTVVFPPDVSFREADMAVAEQDG